MTTTPDGAEAGDAQAHSRGDRSRADQPCTDQPCADRPCADQPCADQPCADRQGVDGPGVDGPGVDGPGVVEFVGNAGPVGWSVPFVPVPVSAPVAALPVVAAGAGSADVSQDEKLAAGACADSASADVASAGDAASADSASAGDAASAGDVATAGDAASTDDAGAGDASVAGSLVDGPAADALALLLRGLEGLSAREAWRLSDEDLAALVQAGEVARRRLLMVQVAAAVEAGRRGLPRRAGFGPGRGGRGGDSAALAAWVRSLVNVSRAQARRVAAVGAALFTDPVAADLAQTRAAALAGQITARHVTVIADAVTQLSPPHVPTDPATGTPAIDPATRQDAQRLLAEHAAVLDPDQTRVAATRTVAVLDPDAGDRLARDEDARENARGLSFTPDGTGLVHLRGTLTPQCAGLLATAIDAASAPQPAADGTPDPRLPAQRRHDGLQHILAQIIAADGTLPSTHGSPYRLVVTVPHTTLRATLTPRSLTPRTGPRPEGTQPPFGQNTAGQNTAGQNTAGQNTGGQNTAGQNTAGQNTAGPNTAGQNTAGQNTAGQNTGGQNTAGPNTAGQNTVGPRPDGRGVEVASRGSHRPTGDTSSGDDGSGESRASASSGDRVTGSGTLPGEVVGHVADGGADEALDPVLGEVVEPVLPGLLPDGFPLSPLTVQTLACSADLVPVLVDHDHQPLDVGDTQYAFPPKIRTAIITRDRGCTYPGCGAPPSWCDVHHLTKFRDGGPTSVNNGALLCGRHHRYVHALDLTGRVTTDPSVPAFGHREGTIDGHGSDGHDHQGQGVGGSRLTGTSRVEWDHRPTSWTATTATQHRPRPPATSPNSSATHDPGRSHQPPALTDRCLDELVRRWQHRRAQAHQAAA